MVRQVRLKENVTDANGNTRGSRVFAFGVHELAKANEVHPVTTAASVGNSLRVIMDELLIGNSLEEIACRGVVDDDAYSRVPLGATPDDVSRCAAADDVLPRTCPDDGRAICICRNPAGCLRDTVTIAEGQPVGILDINQDGGADDTRFIAGSVGIQCGAISVPLDLDMSYWNPSGDQNKPAMGGFDALGPAIVLTPNGPLPTNIACNLTFASDVTDKSGNQVCAPPNGDITIGCTPGDMSQFTFSVEPLTVFPVTFSNNDVGVSRTDPALMALNTLIDTAPANLGRIAITEGGAAFTDFTLALPQPNVLRFTWTNGLQPTTEYKITFPATFSDTYQQGLPAAVTYTFTTGS
ncbi:MAG: Ig-like domain-containing protein [Deltaproteobacteria bacterium]|nr:Ig-like domain-containing protein [Deltaproteobacteria bacterium]